MPVVPSAATALVGTLEEQNNDNQSKAIERTRCFSPMALTNMLFSSRVLHRTTMRAKIFGVFGSESVGEWMNAKINGVAPLASFRPVTISLLNRITINGYKNVMSKHPDTTVIFD